MNRNRKLPAGAMLVCIANQADKHEGKKQRGKKIKSAVLIAGNAVIRYNPSLKLAIDIARVVEAPIEEIFVFK